MGYNSVLDSTRFLVEMPEHVFINNKKLEEVAQRFAGEDLPLASWDAPVYPSENNNELIDFVFLANSINFAFTDFETKEKYATDYLDINWRGAFGMIASIKRAMDDSVPILDAEYLSGISRKEMENIFRGNIEIPMLDERQSILQEVGTVLSKKYAGHFYNLVEASAGKLFDEGFGIVERLALEFPSFDDSVEHYGKSIIFDKRAQLAPAILYARFKNQGDFIVDDIDDLTVFADYVLPKGLRDLGILEYSPSLADRVDNQILIPKNSLEELEIRASTIHAADRLIKGVNELRNYENPINALHMDYKLWSESRGIKDGKPHHLTETIAY